MVRLAFVCLSVTQAVTAQSSIYTWMNLNHLILRQHVGSFQNKTVHSDFKRCGVCVWFSLLKDIFLYAFNKHSFQKFNMLWTKKQKRFMHVLLYLVDKTPTVDNLPCRQWLQTGEQLLTGHKLPWGKSGFIHHLVDKSSLIHLAPVSGSAVMTCGIIQGKEACRMSWHLWVKSWNEFLCKLSGDTSETSLLSTFPHRLTGTDCLTHPLNARTPLNYTIANILYICCLFNSQTFNNSCFGHNSPHG